MEKVIEYDGITWFAFIKEKYHGCFYYRAKRNKKTLLLHRYIWEKYNGLIPNGFDVHHKDSNRENNDINNLELLEHNKHSSITNKGNPKSEETKRKIAISHIGFRHSEESIKKMIEEKNRNSELYRKKTLEFWAKKRVEKELLMQSIFSDV